MPQRITSSTLLYLTTTLYIVSSVFLILRQGSWNQTYATAGKQNKREDSIGTTGLQIFRSEGEPERAHGNVNLWCGWTVRAENAEGLMADGRELIAKNKRVPR